MVVHKKEVDGGQLAARHGKNKESKRESLMRLAGEEFVIIDDFGWPRNPDGYNALVKRVAKESRSQGYSPTHVSPYLCQPAHVES